MVQQSARQGEENGELQQLPTHSAVQSGGSAAVPLPAANPRRRRGLEGPSYEEAGGRGAGLGRRTAQLRRGAVRNAVVALLLVAEIGAAGVACRAGAGGGVGADGQLRLGLGRAVTAAVAEHAHASAFTIALPRAPIVDARPALGVVHLGAAGVAGAAPARVRRGAVGRAPRRRGEREVRGEHGRGQQRERQRADEEHRA